MEKKKIIIPVVTIAVIGAVGGTGYYYRDNVIDVATEAFDVVAEKIPFLQSGKSDDKVYVEKVSKIMNTYTGNTNRYNGVVESQDSYEVNVDSSRTIKEILVKVGDEVEEGQTLVTYDTSELEMQVKQAKLELEGIQNEIDSSNKKIATLTDELNKTTDEDDKFSLTTDIQSEENSIEENKLDLESKNLEISKYEDQIDASSVVSKKSGVVKEINENGTDSNGNNAAFMTILQTGEYRVKGSIDEQNVWMISDGQAVIIRSRVDESQTWNGTISKIDTDNVQKSDDDSSSDSSVSATKYPFYVELPSAEGLLLGQHVYIELDEGQDDQQKEGIWLYSNYVVQDDSGAYVWAANDKKRLEKRYVELGEYDEDLAEYEILRDGKNTIAVTLHRGVRELGDWGVFLTPEAQCLGEKTTEYEIIPHGAGEELYHSYEEAYQFQTDWQTAGMERQAGTLPQTYRFVEMKHLQAVPTALKHSMLTGDVILRFCNLSDEETTVSVSQPEVYTYDLLEKDQLQKEENEIVLGKHEIRTIGWRA